MDRRRAPTQDGVNTNLEIERSALRHIAEDKFYAFYFRDVTCCFEDGVLTLKGRVGSFYLKQMLQTRLRDLPGVARIDNQVDVVSATGISSPSRNSANTGRKV